MLRRRTPSSWSSEVSSGISRSSSLWRASSSRALRLRAPRARAAAAGPGRARRSRAGRTRRSAASRPGRTSARPGRSRRRSGPARTGPTARGTCSPTVSSRRSTFGVHSCCLPRPDRQPVAAGEVDERDAERALRLAALAQRRRARSAPSASPSRLTRSGSRDRHLGLVLAAPEVRGVRAGARVHDRVVADQLEVGAVVPAAAQIGAVEVVRRVGGPLRDQPAVVLVEVDGDHLPVRLVVVDAVEARSARGCRRRRTSTGRSSSRSGARPGPGRRSARPPRRISAYLSDRGGRGRARHVAAQEERERRRGRRRAAAAGRRGRAGRRRRGTRLCCSFASRRWPPSACALSWRSSSPTKRR